MKNKKHFNNILDSVCITLFLFLCIVLYSLTLWFGVINPQDGTRPMFLLFISTLIFVPMILIVVVWIVKDCYEYWILTNECICSKKPFRKKVIIKLKEIDTVERKVIAAFVMSTYKSDAYIIYSKSKKIVILTGERKKFPELDYELAKFVTK